MTLANSLENWVYKEINEILAKEGIKRLTNIQEKVLPFINSKENLVVVSPSGTGKTLIAELIALQNIIKERDENDSFIENENLTHYELKKRKNNMPILAKTVFLVPLRALAEEKANNIARTYKNLKIKVHISISDIEFDEEEIRKSHILISTYERFRIILGRIPNLIHSLQTVVIDEFHLLGDKYRGANLESIIISLMDKVRLVLLSATVENPQDIAEWLNAKLIISQERLIPLEYEIISTFRTEYEMKKIIKRNILEDNQTLVFCGTRIKAEELANYYADFILECLEKEGKTRKAEIQEFLKVLAFSKSSLCNSQIFSLTQKGTAFHHAGISSITKKTIEELFKSKLIKVLFCTETLSAGVNLPAREVIILDTRRWNNELLSKNVFHQIAGRAGRPGYDVIGKCTIFSEDRREAKAIIGRYWKNHNFNNNNLIIRDFEPSFEVITSNIQNRDQLEKTILTLIYDNKLTAEELVQLLIKSFSNNVQLRKSDNAVLEDYYKILFHPIQKFNEKNLENLLEIYPIDGLLKSGEISDNENYNLIITENNTNYFVTLNNSEINCSCTQETPLCKHKIFFLTQLPYQIIGKILTNQFSILHHLHYKGYINESNSSRLQTTTKGSLCAEMGVTTRRFEYLRDWLIFTLNTSKETLREILGCLLKLNPEMENEGYYLQNDLLLKPLYEHIILGKEFNDVIMKHQLYEGDMLRIESSLYSTLTGLIPFASYLGLDKLSNNLQKLERILVNELRMIY